jgi:hypothetical protein
MTKIDKLNAKLAAARDRFRFFACESANLAISGEFEKLLDLQRRNARCADIAKPL